MVVKEMMKKHRAYSMEAYLLLASKLSQQELDCLSHCTVFNDCRIDGNCKIQDKANSILGDCND